MTEELKVTGRYYHWCDSCYDTTRFFHHENGTMSCEKCGTNTKQPRPILVSNRDGAIGCGG